MQPRDRGIRQSLGAPLTTKIHESRILLVGAGGIGCEVLKNLVCCGYGSVPPVTKLQNGHSQGAPGIVVVDLDTIDLSNLNRQFLFRKHHISKPKALVAKETASQYNPSVNIEAHHASIFDQQYNVDFYKSFDIVFNALDNLAARRHVNRMCLAADVPLIESGTTGYNGQVQAIRKGDTECYDCNPKPIQKSYPICTIRSTPSQPIHCIVWAKSYLLPELFGEETEGQGDDMQVTDGDNADEVAKLKEEAEALKRIRRTSGQPGFAQSVFDKVFEEDVDRLRSMSEMWKTRKPPVALRFSSLVDDLDATVRRGEELAARDQNVWSLEENAAVFFYALRQLGSRSRQGVSGIEFDKDDKDTLDFVAAAANLRAHIFDIAATSEWNIKQMAGNIIPAIATSNAMTASLCVLQAFKIMRAITPGEKSSQLSGAKGTQTPKSLAPLGGAKMTFLTSKNADRMITSERLRSPNPQCAVCSPTYAQLQLPSDGVPKLQDLVSLLKNSMGYQDLSISTDAGVIFDPDEDENLDRPLSDFGISDKSNGFIVVTDDADDAKVDLVLGIGLGTVNKLSILPADLTLPVKERAVTADADAEVPSTSNGSTDTTKRKRENDDIELVSKRTKMNAGDEDAILIEDDGTILLDD